MVAVPREDPLAQPRLRSARARPEAGAVPAERDLANITVDDLADTVEGECGSSGSSRPSVARMPGMLMRCAAEPGSSDVRAGADHPAGRRRAVARSALVHAAAPSRNQLPSASRSDRASNISVPDQPSTAQSQPRRARRLVSARLSTASQPDRSRTSRVELAGFEARGEGVCRPAEVLGVGVPGQQCEGHAAVCAPVGPMYGPSASTARVPSSTSPSTDRLDTGRHAEQDADDHQARRDPRRRCRARTVPPNRTVRGCCRLTDATPRHLRGSGGRAEGPAAGSPDEAERGDAEADRHDQDAPKQPAPPGGPTPPPASEENQEILPMVRIQLSALSTD